MAEAGSLNIDLILNSAKFQEGMAKASAAMSAFEKSAKGISKGFTKFGKQLDGIGDSMTKNLTLPIAAAGVAIGAAVVKMADYGSSINDMAVRTGFSRESLQELKFAADQTGVSMESIEGSTRKLTKAMGEAAAGGKVAETFKQLGIEVKNADGSLRPANEVFNETLGALGRIPDETTRNVLGMQLLGKSAGDLTPLIVAGKDGLNAFAKEAREAGLVMSEDAVIAADEFGDKMDKLKAQLGHAGMEIGIAFMPMIEQLMGYIQASVIPAIKHASEWFGSLSDSQKKWIVGIAAALAAIGPLFIGIGKISSAIGFLIPLIAKTAGALSVLGGPITLIVAAVAGAAALIIYNWDSVVKFFTVGEGGKFWNDVTGYAEKFFATMKELFNVSVEFITKIWDRFGGDIMDELTKAFEFLTSIAGNFFSGLGDMFHIFSSLLDGDWSAVWDGIVSVAVNSFQLILKVVTRGIDVFLGIIEKGVGLFSKEWSGGVTKARDSVNGFKDSIVSFTDQFKRTTPEVKEAVKSTEVYTQAIEKAKPKLDALNVSLGTNKTKVQETSAVTKVASLDLSQLGDSWWTMGEAVQTTTPVLTTASETISTAMLDMSSVIQSAMESTIVSVSEAVGNMISGTGKIGGVLTAIMGGIADFVGNFGKAMIAASTAAMLAKASLATPASLAAGAALVGLSVVLKNVISTKPMGFAEGGLVMGETLGLIGEGRGTTRSNPEVVAPLDKLMGFMGDGGGDGGKQVEFIISGETLRGVLRKNGDSRRFLGNG